MRDSRDKQGPPDYPDQGQPHHYPHPTQQQPQQPPQQQHHNQYPAGGYISNWGRPYQHPQQQQQHAPMDENSSAGGNGLARTESGMSDKPLSDEEYRELERTMAQEGYSARYLVLTSSSYSCTGLYSV